MTEEKDPKPGPNVRAMKLTKTLLGGPPRPASRPPLSASLTRDRSRPLVGKDVPKTAPPARAKQALPEEISSSLLESDESSGSMPGLEELSDSLLLDDPTVVQANPDKVQANPAIPLPAPSSPARSATVTQRPPLDLPHLPPSTPGPDLDALLAPASPSSAAAPRPAPDTDPHAFAGGPHPAAAQPGEGTASHAAPEPDPFARPQAAPAVMPQATEPMYGDVEVTSLPRGGLGAAIDAMKRGFERVRALIPAVSTSSQDSRRTVFLAVVALAGLVVGIGLVALVVSLARKAPSDAEARPEASVAEVAPPPSAGVASPPSPVVAPPASASVAPPPPVVEGSSRPCTVAGAPRVVAPSAIIQAGIEVRALGNEVALGFAPDEHRATALRLDPASLSALATVEADSVDSIRRVVPLGSSKAPLRLAVDVDREGDAMQGRRTIPLEPPLQIGAAGGNLVWGRPGGSVAGTLWRIDGEGDVEAARGAAELGDDAASTVVALRHANAIWLGATIGHDALSPRGELSRIAGSGSTVGSPAVAVNDGVVVAAWADRVSANDPWRLKWVHFKAGETPGDPSTFTPPAGGKGAQAMSPGITAVPGGRFLLVWTEGPATGHDVRALTLSREGEPIGKPLDISSKGTNAGQGQAAVNGSREGLVAFLQSSDKGFKVVATPIACGL